MITILLLTKYFCYEYSFKHIINIGDKKNYVYYIVNNIVPIRNKKC